MLQGESLRGAIRAIVERHLDLDRYRVFLFGSESTRTAVLASDIDIGILGDEPVPGRVMESIREELERLRTLRTFDLVDFFSVEDSFRSAALKHAERL